MASQELAGRSSRADDDDSVGPLGDDDGDAELQNAEFEGAASFLAGAVTAGDKRFSDKAKLQFYGLYKQATAGPCSTSRPAFWDPTGRAKW
jgi:hypothetical protein